MIPEFISRVDLSRLKVDMRHLLKPGLESGTGGLSRGLAAGGMRLDW